jgi:hypothetical protein
MEEAEDYLAQLVLDVECVCQGMAERQGSGRDQVDDRREYPVVCSGKGLAKKDSVAKQFVKDLRGPMHEYLETLMNREPVLEDWEIMESARYAFKYVKWPKRPNVNAD